jgi:hypothetical protein
MAIPHSKLILLRALMIVAAGCWVFAPALRGDWIMDDELYLTQNALLHDPARLWKIWFAPGSLIEYYPIEATVQAIQWHFWHLDTLGYHLTNLILHITGALLVWRLLEKFGLRFAWLGGFLFAVHPVVVESVAWISELKNTLSLPPFLLAMCAWMDFEERKRPHDYFAALGLFLLAMLCKISMALFPVIILLYAWWKRRRIGWRDLKAVAPFLVISIVLGATTILAGNWFRAAHHQSTATPPIGDFGAHLALAGSVIAFYFMKCLWPVNMLFIYPQWPVNSHALVSFLPWLVLVSIVFWCWSQRATWGRHALLGIGFFLINLAPFVGFQSVSYMQFTWVMDHFLYIPLIGLIGLAVSALEMTEDRISAPLRPILAAMTAAVLTLLACESYDYAETFIGPETLWTYTLRHNPGSFLARNNLGNVLLETGRAPEAIIEYRKALQLNPEMVEAHTNLGFALEQTGNLSEAIENYELALKVDPHFSLAHAHLADAFNRKGDTQEAIDHYEQVLLVNPNDRHAREAIARLRPSLEEP